MFLQSRPVQRIQLVRCRLGMEPPHSTRGRVAAGGKGSTVNMDLGLFFSDVRVHNMMAGPLFFFKLRGSGHHPYLAVGLERGADKKRKGQHGTRGHRENEREKKKK